MGKTKCRKVVVSLFVALITLLPQNVSAMTVKDFYTAYGKDYTIQYPSNTVSVIKDYIYYHAMPSTAYTHITDSTIDVAATQAEIDKITDEINDIDTQLLSGYNMELNQIYSLESSRAAYEKELDKLNDAMKQSPSIPYTPTSNPSKDDYLNALSVKKNVDASQSLSPLVHAELPADDAKTIYLDSNSIKYHTADKEVKTIFNGQVSSTTQDSITVTSTGGILVTYTSLSKVKVIVGAMVASGDEIGKSTTDTTVSVSLNNVVLDISKIVKGVK